MIVPYEIAVKLKQLGFSKEVYRAYWLESKELTPFNILENYNQADNIISAPTVSEALQWIREKYKMPCNVIIQWLQDLYENYSYENFGYYGEFWILPEGGPVDSIETPVFDTHPEAELSLLKQVVEYLREKKK